MIEPIELINAQPVVIAIGAEVLASALEGEGVATTRVDWRPPLGSADLARYADRLIQSRRVEEANARAVETLFSSRPVLIDVVPAEDVLPILKERVLLHAGPPIEWERMCGPMRGAIIAALMYEGWASTPGQAERMAGSGEVRYAPCHEHSAVGPMAGIISPSMPVMVVEGESGRRSYATFSEGPGKVLRFGAYSQEVFPRLDWMREVLGPSLKRAVQTAGGIDARAIITEAVQMGDDGHNRNKSGTALLFRTLAPNLVESGLPSDKVSQVLRFIEANDHFILNLNMAACKNALDGVMGIKDSTMVVALSRNGVDFGIRVSGLGQRWFTAPAETPVGLFFPGFGPVDANPDMGDSSVTETAGLGAFAMAGAPAIVKFVGGSASDAFAYTREMYEITIAEHAHYRIPAFDFRGTPTGVDIAKVVLTGSRPVINTGMPHRLAGIGQIGAGVVRAAGGCFVRALEAFREVLPEEELAREP